MRSSWPRLFRPAETGRFGVIEVDQESRIIGFVEKPKKPPVAPWNSSLSLISMGVYLFRTPALIKALIQDARNQSSSHDFGRDILPKLIHGQRIYAHLFEGYWEDIGTIDAYWKANMSFLSPESPFQLMDQAWPIRTYKPQYPPTLFLSGEITNSIVGSGCVVSGCTIRNSIISPGVRVKEGAVVEDSIILEGAQIGSGAKVRRAIIDKFSIIPSHFAVGFDDLKDSKNFKVSKLGIRVIPKNWMPG